MRRSRFMVIKVGLDIGGLTKFQARRHWGVRRPATRRRTDPEELELVPPTAAVFQSARRISRGVDGIADISPFTSGTVS